MFGHVSQTGLIRTDLLDWRVRIEKVAQKSVRDASETVFLHLAGSGSTSAMSSESDRPAPASRYMEDDPRASQNPECTTQVRIIPSPRLKVVRYSLLKRDPIRSVTPQRSNHISFNHFLSPILLLLLHQLSLLRGHQDYASSNAEYIVLTPFGKNETGAGMAGVDSVLDIACLDAFGLVLDLEGFRRVQA